MKIKILFTGILILTLAIKSEGQGYNHQWLLGSYNLLQDPKGRMFIDSNSVAFATEFRKMAFKGTEGNICDVNGNFLMSSNGIWIANSTNHTMMNGSGLNPTLNYNQITRPRYSKLRNTAVSSVPLGTNKQF